MILFRIFVGGDLFFKRLTTEDEVLAFTPEIRLAVLTLWNEHQKPVVATVTCGVLTKVLEIVKD